VDVLHKTEVTPDQIDHLGHMNVRYYGQAARTAAEHLLASLGLESDDRRAVTQRDTYTRHHREQLVGSPLEVRGGVLDVSGERIRLYEELANTDTGDLAATFVFTFETSAPGTREPVAIDDATADAARSALVELPDHGRPRSLSLDGDPAATAPALDLLVERDLAIREVRTIDATICEPDGVVAPMAIAELVWGGQPVPDHNFQPFEPLPDGGQMGFATMETRATWARVARVGERIQSFGAETDIGTKTMISRHWLYDVDRRDLVGVFSVVGLGFDMATRRAHVIPDGARARLSRRLHPDLG